MSISLSDYLKSGGSIVCVYCNSNGYFETKIISGKIDQEKLEDELVGLHELIVLKRSAGHWVIKRVLDSIRNNKGEDLNIAATNQIAAK